MRARRRELDGTLAALRKPRHCLRLESMDVEHTGGLPLVSDPVPGVVVASAAEYGLRLAMLARHTRGSRPVLVEKELQHRGEQAAGLAACSAAVLQKEGVTGALP